jgi:NAD(P)-dependent dehydrogenase (short-subunit alcohol dehydrogenase family)
VHRDETTSTHPVTELVASLCAYFEVPAPSTRLGIDVHRIRAARTWIGFGLHAHPAHHFVAPIDILVNSAGYAVWKPLEATSMAEWDQTFAVNVRAAAYVCAAVLPKIQQRTFGRICPGSTAAVAIVPGLAAYSVSKHALRALTAVIQAATTTSGSKHGRSPGFVDTEMGYVVPGAKPENFLSVDEVVDVVQFLFHTGDNVKLGPEVLIRTMRNPMPS